MATDYGYGLRLMQGGVDRTGLASMADSLGTPGLDLINKRRQEQALADAIAASQSENIIDPSSITTNNVEDSGFSFNDIFSGVDDYTDSFLTDLGQQKKDQIIEGAGNIGSGISDLMENPYNLLPGNLSYNIADKLGLIQEPDPENEPLFTIDVPEIIDKTKEKLSDMYNSEAGQFTRDVFSIPFLYAKDRFIDPYFVSDNDPMTFKADGGRVHLQGGGMDAGASSASGDRGFGAGVSRGVQSAMGGKGNSGGKKDPSKEVDIDQLEKKEEPVVTVQPAVKPTLDDLMQQQLSPYAPVEEASMIDTLSKYNPLAQTFAINPNLSFNYDIDPNLKDLSDLNAQANLTYSFNRGGPVSETMQDAIDDMKAEVLARKAEEFRSRMEQPLDKPSLDQYTEDSMLMLSERPDSVFLDPPVGIDGNTIQEAPPIGISGTITDDELTAGYGMPVGTGGISGQLTMPFENDPMLQLMLEQQLADDLSLNADVSLMEDMDPFFSLKMTKDF